MTQGLEGLPVLQDGAPPEYPSIFNDVIGPVMRGPSSSHCAAAVRIGRLARDLMGGEITEVLVEFHPDGSLATTHESQGSDMGLFGGLLGWDAAHERLVDSAEAMAEAGIRVEVRITDFPAFHPNTYRLTLRNQKLEHRMTALSTGGGIIKVVEVDGVSMSMAGDLHETLVFLRAGGLADREGGPADSTDGGGGASGGGAEEKGWDPGGLRAGLESGFDAFEVLAHPWDGGVMVQIRAPAFPPSEALQDLLKGIPGLPPSLRISEIRTLAPVLPIESPAGVRVPFLTARELLAYNEGRGMELWELAVEYESARGGISPGEVLGRMEEIVEIMEGSVQAGITGTEYQDRILPAQTGLFKDSLETGSLLEAGILNRAILYVSAIMEVKSSMGVVVAAPTAGSCGALPGVVLAAGHIREVSREELAKAILAAGLIGVFISAGSTFAAEVCGCQAECGAGSGMAAAALVTMAGGSTNQALSAASLALQNTLGMICDPVANRVEVPCLGRNVLAASNALACSNMALSGFDEVIPLDEVIRTMDEVGKSMPHELRCTALGGLSVTDTSKAIERRLKESD